MPRQKKEVLLAKINAENEEYIQHTSTTLPDDVKLVFNPKITPLELNLGREDLNQLVAKLNEVIKKINE